MTDSLNVDGVAGTDFKFKIQILNELKQNDNHFECVDFVKNTV